MNASVERGFAVVLRESLVGLQVREATCSEPLPSDLQLAVVECASVEHVAGPLHKAAVKVWLGTPAFDASEAEHARAANRLCAALDAAASDTVAAAALFDPACQVASWRGCFVKSASLDIVDNTWRTTAEVVLGLCAAG